jgi:hypothetical protein
MSGTGRHVLCKDEAGNVDAPAFSFESSSGPERHKMPFKDDHLAKKIDLTGSHLVHLY